MYVWTVKGKTIEDISVIYDNDSLYPQSSGDIIDRINKRKKRREKWQESKS